MSNTPKLYYHPIIKNYACDIEGNIYSFYVYGGNGSILNIPRKMDIWNPLNGYKRFTVKRKLILAHIFVYECVKNTILLLGKHSSDLTINHINGNKLDNSFNNLELITHRLNNQLRFNNKIKSNGLPKGVYYMKDGVKIRRYRVKISIPGNKDKHFGVFLTQEEAYQVSKRVYKEYFNEDI